MTHDFEESLKTLTKNHIKDYLGQKYDTVGGVQVDTIKLALRIADRLQKGEVSDGMMQKWYKLTGFENIQERAFKAMLQQLIKECEDEASTD